MTTKNAPAKKATKPAAKKGPTKAKLAELESKIVDTSAPAAGTGTKAKVDALEAAITASAAATKADGRNRPDTWVLSTTPKPTKKVWVVAESMPGASRKEVIAECINRGIAPGTSRTQYQAWFKATRDSKPA